MKPRAYPNFRLPQRMGLGISTLGNGFELLPEVIFLRKRGLDSCLLVEVNGLAAALKALW